MIHAVGVSIAALTAVERTRNEVMHSHMRKAAVERINQMQDENEISWPDLALLSEGRDEAAAAALRYEASEAARWWRGQLEQAGYEAETIERLVKAYTDAFWTTLRDRVCGY